MRRSFPLVGLVAIGAGISLALGVHAQRPGRVLHRPLPGDPTLLEELDRRLLAPPSSADGLRRAAGPGSSWTQSQPVDESVIHPRDSWQAPLRELDRQTQSAPGTRLAYAEVFTPSVTPFKRGQAYDLIDEMGRLSVRDPSLRAMTVGGPVPAAWRAARRARFVGELLVELSPAFPTPVPGVAGEQRVVSYTTSTGQSVEFAQDSAGNLFVRALEPGTARLTYVLEAPDFALQPSFVPHTSIADAAATVPPDERPSVPSWLRVSARRVLGHVGIATEPMLDAALGRLVGYFRAFRDGELPDGRGADIYTDLALGGVGACRHRAYGLMPTLIAMGLPARYVGNEAHAWVEIWFRETGWTRIDLGGWDVPLDERAPSSRPSYRPTRPDPFPTPPEYAGQYSAQANAPVSDGGVATLGPESADVETPAEPSGTGGASASSTASRPMAASRAAPGTTAPRVRGNETTGGAPLDPGASDEPTATDLTLGPVRVDENAGVQSRGGIVRGSMVRIDGAARDPQGAGVGGLPVEIELWRGQRPVRALGATVTRADGHWEAHVLLPADVGTGEYSVRAATPGNARHRAAVAE